jgi:hypothetical protein
MVCIEGVPRGKMPLLMGLIAPEIRQGALHLISRFFISSYKWAMQNIYDSQIGVVYTHQKVSRIIGIEFKLRISTGRWPVDRQSSAKMGFRARSPLAAGSGTGLARGRSVEEAGLAASIVTVLLIPIVTDEKFGLWAVSMWNHLEFVPSLYGVAV